LRQIGTITPDTLGGVERALAAILGLEVAASPSAG